MQRGKSPSNVSSWRDRRLSPRQAHPHPSYRSRKVRMRTLIPCGQYELVPYRGKLAVAIGRGASRRRISTGTNDAGLAKAVAERIWEGHHAPSSERVEDLWQFYLSDRRKDGRDTIRQQNAWKRLAPMFGRRLGNGISRDDCRDYARLRQRHGAASGTVKTELEYLRACLNLRYGRGNNHVWTPPASAPRDRNLTPRGAGYAP